MESNDLTKKKICVEVNLIVTFSSFLMESSNVKTNKQKNGTYGIRNSYFKIRLHKFTGSYLLF